MTTRPLALALALVAGLIFTSVGAGQETAGPSGPSGARRAVTPGPAGPSSNAEPVREAAARDDGLQELQLEDALVRASKAFGLPIVYSPHDVRGKPPLNFAGGIDLDARTESKFWQEMIAQNGYALIRSRLASGDVYKLEPVDGSRRLKSSARFIPASRIAEAEETPAEVVMTVVTLENVSIQSLRSALSHILVNRTLEFAQEIPGANAILVAGLGPTVATVTRALEAMDRPPRSLDTKAEIYALRHARARDIASVVSDILANRGGAAPQAAGPGIPAAQFRITADRATNSVLVSGTAEEVKRAGRLISELDRPAKEEAPRPEPEATPRQVVVIRLQHAHAGEMYGILRRFVQERSNRWGHDAHAIILPDERLNSLVIEAPEPAMGLIRALVEQLDVPLEEEQESAEESGTEGGMASVAPRGERESGRGDAQAGAASGGGGDC